MKVAYILLVLATPGLAQVPEDAAHRADRLRTQELNQRSPNGYSQRSSTAGTDDRSRDDYDRAQAEYRQRLADWRRRVAACERGYYDACEQ